MSKTIDYYFDFGSPNCYLAHTQLAGIAERTGAQVVYKPMLLGGVFKATGNASPATIAAKGNYTGMNTARFAARYGVPFERNPHFPVNTLQIMRGAVAYRDADKFMDYVELMSHAMWVEPKKLDDGEVLAEVLAGGGFDAEDFAGLVGDPEVKQRLIAATEEAVARGVFGAPTFFVGEEMFFGQDMLWLVEETAAAA